MGDKGSVSIRGFRCKVPVSRKRMNAYKGIGIEVIKDKIHVKYIVWVKVKSVSYPEHLTEVSYRVSLNITLVRRVSLGCMD